MPFTPSGDSRGVPIRAIANPGYSTEDIALVNRVFQFCEEVYLGTTLRSRNAAGGEDEIDLPGPEVRDAILNHLAEEGWSCALWGDDAHDDDIHEIYDYCASSAHPGHLPRNPAPVMALVRSFARRCTNRAIGNMADGARLWDDVLNSTDRILTEAHEIITQVVIPGEAHASSSLSMLWNNPPACRVTATTVRFHPTSVQPHYGRVRGTMLSTFERSSDVLNNTTRVARVTHIATRANTIFQLGQGAFRFSRSSERWRNTLQRFREDPTPENLVAYGVAAHSMTNDISQMLHNIPCYPGNIPFYSSAFNDVGRMASTMVRILGGYLCRVNSIIAEAERGVYATERGVGGGGG